MVSAALGVVLLVFPWLGRPLVMLGFVGMGKASPDLFHAFWDGQSEAQRAELLGAGLSLVLSAALALVPGGQVWLKALSLTGLALSLPAARRDPFDLSGCR